MSRWQLGQRWQEIFRFLLSGGVGFVLYYVFALVLDATFDLSAGVIAWLAVICAIGPVFFLQRMFTFRVRDGSATKQLISYASLQMLVAALIGTTASLASRFSMDARTVYFLSGLVGVAFSFLVQKFLIFHSR